MQLTTLLLLLSATAAARSPREPVEPFAFAAGVTPTLVGWRGSATHDVLPALSLWATHSPRPWAVSGELLGAWSSDEALPYRFTALHLRAAVLGELAVGGRASTFHAGLGPALAIRTGRLGGHAPFTELDPGARARVALTGPVIGPLAYTWHTGVTARLHGIDYDAGVGLGIGW